MILIRNRYQWAAALLAPPVATNPTWSSMPIPWDDASRSPACVQPPGTPGGVMPSVPRPLGPGTPRKR